MLKSLAWSSLEYRTSRVSAVAAIVLTIQFCMVDIGLLRLKPYVYLSVNKVYSQSAHAFRARPHSNRHSDEVQIETHCRYHGNLTYAKTPFQMHDLLARGQNRSHKVKSDFRLMFIRDSSNSLGFMILSDFIWIMFHSSWISIVIIQIIYIGKVDTEVIRKSRTRSNSDVLVSVPCPTCP